MALTPGSNCLSRLRVFGDLELLPLLTDTIVPSGRSAMSRASRSMAVWKSPGPLLAGGLGQGNSGLEEPLEQRLGLAGFGLGELVLIEVLESGEVVPVVEDQEVGLVLAGAEEVVAEPGAPADHLPELHVGVDRLGEDEVDDLGHVDAGVEHVDRDGDRKQRLAESLNSSIRSCGRGS